jgi:hypothetical protein
VDNVQKVNYWNKYLYSIIGSCLLVCVCFVRIRRVQTTCHAGEVAVFMGAWKRVINKNWRILATIKMFLNLFLVHLTPSCAKCRNYTATNGKDDMEWREEVGGNGSLILGTILAFSWRLRKIVTTRMALGPMISWVRRLRRDARCSPNVHV